MADWNNGSERQEKKNKLKINVHVKHWRETYAIYKFPNSQLTKPLQPSLLPVSSRWNGLRAREEFNENRSILSIFRLFHFTLAKSLLLNAVGFVFTSPSESSVRLFRVLDERDAYCLNLDQLHHSKSIDSASQIRRHSDVMQANKLLWRTPWSVENSLPANR